MTPCGPHSTPSILADQAPPLQGAPAGSTGTPGRSPRAGGAVRRRGKRGAERDAPLTLHSPGADRALSDPPHMLGWKCASSRVESLNDSIPNGCLFDIDRYSHLRPQAFWMAENGHVRDALRTGPALSAVRSGTSPSGNDQKNPGVPDFGLGHPRPKACSTLRDP